MVNSCERDIGHTGINLKHNSLKLRVKEISSSSVVAHTRALETFLNILSYHITQSTFNLHFLEDLFFSILIFCSMEATFQFHLHNYIFIKK